MSPASPQGAWGAKRTESRQSTGHLGAKRTESRQSTGYPGRGLDLNWTGATCTLIVHVRLEILCVNIYALATFNRRFLAGKNVQKVDLYMLYLSVLIKKTK